MYRHENQNQLIADLGRTLRRFGVVIAVLGCPIIAAATPPYFSVDDMSPTVTTDGHSAATIFENEEPDDGAAPPNLICRTPADLGLGHTDEVDAVCQANLLLLDAPAIVWTSSGWGGNIYAWSIDRDSVGKRGGDWLCDWAGGYIPSMGSPELTETTSNNASACGDVFAQMWMAEGQEGGVVRGRLNLKLFDEPYLEEYGGAFGDPDLDDLDALELLGECNEEYYFSLNPASAAAHGVGPADILRYSVNDGTFVVVRTAAELGLAPGDDIDAMQVLLWDDFLVAISLSRGSPSLVEAGAGFTWSAADIFLVGDGEPFPGANTTGDTPDNRCWIPAEYLSLLPTDNIDAFFGGAGDPGEVFGGSGPGAGPEGDLDGDCDVDLSDLAQLLSAYGTCAGDAGFSEEADINHNGCVDLADLAALLANYGTQCP